ncbi:MAG: SPOR domain-containing protein [Gammaproteobacteria bacterium]|nr:SPOR domain-containing protein [Gammaproteobacteria bacterium]
MADYKHRAAPKSRVEHASNNSALWFFGGFITGAFLMGLVWLKLGPDLADGRVPGLSQDKPAAAQTKRKTAPKPEYQFYTILPEMEVVIPDEEILPPKSVKPQPLPTEQRQTQPRPEEAFILQMGSFRKFVDADRMKARLALIGIEAEIQKVSINNKDTFHRVRSGPYANQSQLNRVRNLARENGISTLVIKLKG